VTRVFGINELLSKQLSLAEFQQGLEFCQVQLHTKHLGSTSYHKAILDRDRNPRVAGVLLAAGIPKIIGILVDLGS
jgi:hypothetical protein